MEQRDAWKRLRERVRWRQGARKRLVSQDPIIAMDIRIN
jgi:hypothetical protein